MGSLAASPQLFQSAWNGEATNGVSSINSWRQVPVAGVIASIGDLGGNIRIVVASETPTGPVAVAMLAWLPEPDATQIAPQNQAYRNAFAVLMNTGPAIVHCG